MKHFYKDIAGIKVQYLNAIKVKKPNCIYVKNPTIESLENALDHSLVIKAKMVYLYGDLISDVIEFYKDFDNLLTVKKKFSNVYFVNFQTNKSKMTTKQSATILEFKRAN